MRPENEARDQVSQHHGLLELLEQKRDRGSGHEDNAQILDQVRKMNHRAST